MDKRLQEIIDEGNEIRSKQRNIEAEKKEAARKEREAENKKFKSKAKLWVSANIFNLIKEADHKGKNSLYFSDVGHDVANRGSGIPSFYLIEEIRRIDGLKIESTSVDALNSHDGPGWDAHTDYRVLWRPDADAMYKPY